MTASSGSTTHYKKTASLDLTLDKDRRSALERGQSCTSIQTHNGSQRPPGHLVSVA